MDLFFTPNSPTWGVWERTCARARVHVVEAGEIVALSLFSLVRCRNPLFCKSSHFTIKFLMKITDLGMIAEKIKLSNEIFFGVHLYQF